MRITWSVVTQKVGPETRGLWLGSGRHPSHVQSDRPAWRRGFTLRDLASKIEVWSALLSYRHNHTVHFRLNAHEDINSSTTFARVFPAPTCRSTSSDRSKRHLISQKLKSHPSRINFTSSPFLHCRLVASARVTSRDQITYRQYPLSASGGLTDCPYRRTLTGGEPSLVPTCTLRFWVESWGRSVIR